MARMSWTRRVSGALNERLSMSVGPGDNEGASMRGTTSLRGAEVGYAIERAVSLSAWAVREVTLYNLLVRMAGARESRRAAWGGSARADKGYLGVVRGCPGGRRHERPQRKTKWESHAHLNNFKAVATTLFLRECSIDLRECSINLPECSIETLDVL